MLLSLSFFPKLSDPKVGVVLGSYGMPSFIELNIKLIRHTCGSVPILVVDDCSSGYGGFMSAHGSLFDKISQICDRYGVCLRTAGIERIGHAGGDLGSYWYGIQWAAGLGIQVLAKISQRMIVTKPRWLHDSAEELLQSKKPFASKPCQEGSATLPYRTELCLFDVLKWNKPRVLNMLYPRRVATAAEAVIDEALKAYFNSQYYPWSIYGENRYEKNEGMLWHCSNSVAEYHELAKKFDVQLGEDFELGWHGHRADYVIG